MRSLNEGELHELQKRHMPSMDAGSVSKEDKQEVHKAQMAAAEKRLEESDMVLPTLGFGPKLDQAPLHFIPGNMQPWHRQALVMSAGGWSLTDIATEVGKSYDSVKNAAKAAWFQEERAKLVEKLGVADKFEIFKAEIMGAAMTVLEVMRDPKAGHGIRLAAANSVLDRVLGKPTQKIETTNKQVFSDNPVAECARLQAERASLAKEIGEEVLASATHGTSQ